MLIETWGSAMLNRTWLHLATLAAHGLVRLLLASEWFEHRPTGPPGQCQFKPSTEQNLHSK
jgi:hypothetical protein